MFLFIFLKCPMSLSCATLIFFIFVVKSLHLAWFCGRVVLRGPSVMKNYIVQTASQHFDFYTFCSRGISRIFFKWGGPGVARTQHGNTVRGATTHEWDQKCKVYVTAAWNVSVIFNPPVCGSALAGIIFIVLQKSKNMILKHLIIFQLRCHITTIYFHFWTEKLVLVFFVFLFCFFTERSF